MDDQDPYWQQRCAGCNTGHTNLECVTQVAENVGMSIEEAKKVFIPQGQIRSVQVDDKWVDWSSKHKVDSDG